MQNISHSRKISCQEKMDTEVIQSKIRQHQLCFARSTKDSPQESHLHWLRSTHCVEIGRIRSDQKSKQRYGQLYWNGKGQKKKPWQLMHSQNIAKLRPLFLFPNLSLESALYIVQKSIKEYTSLEPCEADPTQSQSQPLPNFNIKNCYINTNNELVIKFYHPFLHNYRNNQTDAQSQCHIVRDVIEAVHKMCFKRVFDDFYSYYKRAVAKKMCDFKYTLSLIKSYCSCAKVNVGAGVFVQNLGEQHREQGKGQKNENINPRSTQKISPFVMMITSKVTRRKSSKRTQRNSVHADLFDSRTKQKQNNLLKPSVQAKLQKTPITPLQKCIPQKPPQRTPHIFLPVPASTSPVPVTSKISIQPQFNILLSPKCNQPIFSPINPNTAVANAPEINAFSNTLTQVAGPTSIKKQETKTSTVSTNFNSSLHNTETESSTTIFKSKLSLLSPHQPAQKEYFSFLPPDLDQVQSLGQSSDQDSLLPTRRFETPKDLHLENIRRENQNRILSINNWTRKVQGLLEEERDIKESICEDHGKENQDRGWPKQHASTQNLKKMVRAVVESVLPAPSEFLIKQL